MNLDLEIPKYLPAITLPETVLFPQVVLPLHIFEERYKRMVAESLDSDRIFAVLTLNETQSLLDPEDEPPHSVATAGVIRACQKGENGTSNLVLQGLCRIQVEKILREDPYRMIEIKPLLSQPISSTEESARLRNRLLRGLQIQHRLGSPITREMLRFLRGLPETETIADMVAFSLCPDTADKLRLLETLEVAERLRFLIALTEKDITSRRLQQKLQGNLEDDDIANN